MSPCLPKFEGYLLARGAKSDTSNFSVAYTEKLSQRGFKDWSNAKENYALTLKYICLTRQGPNKTKLAIYGSQHFILEAFINFNK